MIFNGIIKNNPCSGIKLPKLEKKLPNYLTIDEIDKLLDIKLTKPIDYRNKAMLEVLFATGTICYFLCNMCNFSLGLNILVKCIICTVVPHCLFALSVESEFPSKGRRTR